MLGRLLVGQVATEYSLLRQRFLYISTSFRSRQGFLGRNRASWPYVATWFPYVVTWFSVLNYRQCRNMALPCCERFSHGWGFLSRDRTFLVTTQNRKD